MAVDRHWWTVVDTYHVWADAYAARKNITECENRYKSRSIKSTLNDFKLNSMISIYTKGIPVASKTSEINVLSLETLSFGYSKWSFVRKLCVLLPAIMKWWLVASFERR